MTCDWKISYLNFAIMELKKWNEEDDDMMESKK